MRFFACTNGSAKRLHGWPPRPESIRLRAASREHRTTSLRTSHVRRLGFAPAVDRVKVERMAVQRATCLGGAILRLLDNVVPASCRHFVVARKRRGDAPVLGGRRDAGATPDVEFSELRIRGRTAIVELGFRLKRLGSSASAGTAEWDQLSHGLRGSGGTGAGFPSRFGCAPCGAFG